MEKQNVYVIDSEAARASSGASANAEPEKKKKRGGAKRPAATAGAHGGLPRLGASCSMLISGSGHLIHRRWKTGVFYLIVFAGMLSTPFLFGAEWSRLETLAARQGLGTGDLLVGLLLLDVFFLAAWLSSVHSAYSVGRACSGDTGEEPGHPLGAAVASLLVPGWGQIVNRQIGKALAFLAVVYAAAIATIAWVALPGPIGALLAVIPVPAPQRELLLVLVAAVIGSVTWALSLYDAVLVARYGRPARAQVQVHSRVRRRRRTSDTVSAARSA